MVFDAFLTAEHEGGGELGLISLTNDFILSKMMTWGEFFAIDGSTDFEASHCYRTNLNSADTILEKPMSQLVWLSP